MLTSMQLKEIVFRGQVTSAMIYDDQPVIDYFRLVDDKTVAGIMEGKKLNGLFYFYLTRPWTWPITEGIQGMFLDRVEKEGFLAKG